MKVLAISGSLRRDSHNTTLLRAAAELLPPSVELEIFDGLKAVEPYDEDDDVGRARGRTAAARGDRVRRRASDRHPRIQLVDARAAQERGRLGLPALGRTRSGASPSRWSVPAPACSERSGHRPRCGRRWPRAGARVIDKDLPVGHADEAFTDDGRLADIELRERYDEILDELVALAEQTRHTERSPPSAAARRLSRWRRASNRITAAATEAFNESTARQGDRDELVAGARHPRAKPGSLGAEDEHGAAGPVDVGVRRPPRRRRRRSRPRAPSPRRASPRGSSRATGRCSTAPAEALQAAGGDRGGAPLGDDDAGGAGDLRGPADRTQVVRVLDLVEHDDERVLRFPGSAGRRRGTDPPPQPRPGGRASRRGARAPPRGSRAPARRGGPAASPALPRRRAGDRRCAHARARLAAANEPGAARLVADLPAHLVELVTERVGAVEVLRGAASSRSTSSRSASRVGLLLRRARSRDRAAEAAR